MPSIHEELRDQTSAELWLRTHAHETLLLCIETLIERYKLTMPQAQDLIRQYVFCVYSKRGEVTQPSAVILIPNGSK